jgi:hypothetical protein
MTIAADSRRLITTAVILSLLVHGLVALVIPAMAWTESTATPFETISFIHIAHIEVAQHHPVHQAPRALAPEKSVAPAVHFVTHHELARTTGRRHAVMPHNVTASRSTAPTVAMDSQAGSATGTGSDPPQPAATPAHAVSTVGNHDDGGYMPFGAEQPDPVLDPGIQKQLAALGVHVTLVVTVGVDGRTKNILFQPTIDAALETRIQSLLSDANWDPAVCGGGVACEAQATIKL